MSPIQKCCILQTHEEATLPLSLLPSLWPSPLPLPLPSPLSSPTPPPLLLPLPNAVAIAIGHCRCGHSQPSPPPSLLSSCQPSLLPLPSPSPSAIAASVTVSHHSCHLHWSSPSPLLPAISKSCCLGAAMIVFEQLKQRMLTLFYFVWTVGDA